MFSKKDNGTSESAPTGAVSNLINQDTLIEGNITTKGNLRVDGKVIGNITAEAKVVLGNNALVKGKIISKNAEIGGRVEGTVEISELLILKSSADVQGDIITKKLVLDAGASFNGQCKMGEISLKQKPTHVSKQEKEEK